MLQVDDLLSVWETYRQARLALLDQIACSGSNRDPLAEFSERLVVSLLGGQLASSRVQKGYDMIGPAGEYIQVKYLANSGTKWVNQQTVTFDADVDAYALVFFIDLRPERVFFFVKGCLATVCQALRKRHPDQDVQLQLTQSNYNQICAERERFKALGLAVFDLAPVTISSGLPRL